MEKKDRIKKIIARNKCISSDGSITRKFLLENGFEEKPEVVWFGNGHDYVDTPENGGSRTIQRDFVLYENDVNLIVRFEFFTYNEKVPFRNIDGVVNIDRIVTNHSISFHYGDWYARCNNIIPICTNKNNKYKISDLLLAYKVIAGKDLKLKKEHYEI